MRREKGGTGTRPPYIGPERRRPLILAAASDEFAEGGFAGARMQAIADRAGVSKALVYDCFPGGKTELYFALLDRAESIVLAPCLAALEWSADRPLEDALRAWLSAFLEAARHNPLEFRMLFGDIRSADPVVVQRSGRPRELLVAKLGERTAAVATPDHHPGGVDVYPRGIFGVAHELAWLILRQPEIPSEPLAQAAAAWLVGGISAAPSAAEVRRSTA